MGRSRVRCIGRDYRVPLASPRPLSGPVQAPRTIPITQLGAFGKGTTVQLEHPMGFLLTWSAESTAGQQRPTWVHRFACPVK